MSRYEVTSGEDVGPLLGRCIGASLLSAQKLPPTEASIKSSPQSAALSSSVLLYQAMWWALKLPVTRTSPSAEKNCP